ncbi:MAG: dihydroorotase [Methanomassiliicoccaceae archaeon]|jgi:dihydroorotase|nr:dihydroorotase [Methanomassiliicoccaceae archaeon]
MIVLEGRVFFNGELRQGAVGIEDGKIADVRRTLKGDKNIDLGDRIILPGAIDPHVHFRDPGMTNKEDFTSGSSAALHGGVTCVLDMPNTKPPVTDARSLEDKKRIIKGRSFVDYGLFAALTKKYDASTLSKKVAGFKLFMGSTTGELLLNDDNEMYRAVYNALQTGKRVSVHAEDEPMISRNEERNNRDHLRNRPVHAEYSAINKLSGYKGMKVNICHITDAHSAALASSYGFTTEVTSHHLLFDDSISEKAEYKVNPPLRDTDTRERLYKAFIDAKITMFGSDHAPHTVDEKHTAYDYAPSGMPGVETYMPMMAEMVRKGNITMQQMVRMSSSAPAEAFGINKGVIEKGRDADLAVYDMRVRRTIKAKDLHSKAGYTPYEGRDAVFPDIVIIRGNMQIKDGELCGDRTGEDIFE